MPDNLLAYLSVLDGKIVLVLAVAVALHVLRLINTSPTMEDTHA